MASSKQRVLMIDLTLDEDVRVCLSHARKREKREREAIVVVEKKLKRDEEDEEEEEKTTDEQYDEEALIEDLIKALQDDADQAGVCLKFALTHYEPDPELGADVGGDPFVFNAEEIMNDAELHFCF